MLPGPAKAFFLNLFIFIYYLFLAVLGLHFCARAFSSCGKRGPLFITVRGPLTVAASLVAEHRLQTRRLSSCGSRAQLLRGMWDLPRPGLEPISPALAGRFSTTAPPGKPQSYLLELTEPPFTSACHAVGTGTGFRFRDTCGRIVGVQVPVGRGASWFLFIAFLELMVSFYLSKSKELGIVITQ